MSLSLTWTELPPYLLQPLMDQVLTLAEASEMLDLMLVSESEEVEVPPRLKDAAARLWLWAQEASPTRH